MVLLPFVGCENINCIVQYFYSFKLSFTAYMINRTQEVLRVFSEPVKSLSSILFG